MINRVLESQSVFAAGCRHGVYWVNESLTDIVCRRCKQSVNPIWVLQQYQYKENSLRNQIDYMDRVLKKAHAKNRCKCQHCGKMTKIEK